METLDLKMECPKLNRDNFLEFRDEVMDKALRFGEAGIILRTGREADGREPNIDQRVLIEDPEHPGQFVEGPNRKYVNNEVGRATFQADLSRWHRLREKKLGIISMLLTHMERDIRARVDATPGFVEACAQADMLRVWNIIQDTVMGRGSTSAYSLMAKLQRLKQKGAKDWPRFLREFTSLRVEIQKHGDANRLLGVYWSCLFISSVDQDYFKEELRAIYALNDWGQLTT